MKMSDKILALRKQAGLSQEQLAEQLRVSRQAVSRWEVGTAMPDATNILLLSKLFGVTTDYLLYDEPLREDASRAAVPDANGGKQILFYLIALEVMALLIQFVSVVILQSLFFGVLSMLPFAALVFGFEYAHRKAGTKRSSYSAVFRKRFYKISIWIGTYFPVRLLVRVALELLAWVPSGVIFEFLILSIYFAAALLLDLALEKSLVK